MNEVQVKILEDIFSMVPEGTFADIDELQEFIEDEGVEELFTMVPEGVFEDEEQFEEFVTPLKKKDFSPAGPTQTMDSDTPGQEEISEQRPGSSASPNAIPNRTPDRTPVDRLNPRLNALMGINQEDKLPETLRGKKFGADVDVGEKDTWLEEMVGKNAVTDFFGDIYRAGAQGIGQGATIDDARRLFVSGS